LRMCLSLYPFHQVFFRYQPFVFSNFLCAMLLVTITIHSLTFFYFQSMFPKLRFFHLLTILWCLEV
jgi:hypothetical protein